MLAQDRAADGHPLLAACAPPGPARAPAGRASSSRAARAAAPPRAPAPVAAAARRSASRSSPGARHGACVTGSKTRRLELVRQPLLQRLLERLRAPRAEPEGGQLGVAQAGRGRGRDDLDSSTGSGSPRAARPRSARPADRPPAHDGSRRSLVAHRVLDEQVRVGQLAAVAARGSDASERPAGSDAAAPRPRRRRGGRRGRGRRWRPLGQAARSRRASAARAGTTSPSASAAATGARRCTSCSRNTRLRVASSSALERPPASMPAPSRPSRRRVAVLLGLQLAHQPHAHVGEALVVEVDGVLRREHDADALRARLLQQREQRPLGRRVGRMRREVAEDLVHVDERAQLATCRSAGASRSSPCRAAARSRRAARRPARWAV